MSARKTGVVIPTFNRRHLVGATLLSVLHQDAPDELTVVVVDDGSTDGTVEHLLSRFRAHVRAVDDRVAGARTDVSPAGRVLVVRQPNQHIAVARNTGLRALLAAGCTHLTHQDSDDLALPHKLRLLGRFLDEHPSVGLVHAQSQDMSFDGFLLPEGRGPFEDTYRRARPGGALWDRAARGELRRGELEQVNYVHNQATMYTRAAVTALGDDGWFPAGVRYGEDWAFYKRLEAAGVGIGFVPRYVSISRAHAAGLSAGRGGAEAPDELFAAALKAPLREKLEPYLRARWRAPLDFEAGLARCGATDDFARLTRALHEEIRAARAAGKVPEALNLAHRLSLLQPSDEALAAAHELAGALVGMLAPARDQALRGGDVRAALPVAKQVFALDPSREHADALARALAQLEP